MISIQHDQKEQHETAFKALNSVSFFLIVIYFLNHFLLYFTIKYENATFIAFVTFYIFSIFFISLQKSKADLKYSKYVKEIFSLKKFEEFIIILDKDLKNYLLIAIAEHANKLDPKEFFLPEIIEVFSADNSITFDELLEELKGLYEKNKSLCSNNPGIKNDLDVLLKYIQAIEYILYNDHQSIKKGYENNYDNDEEEEEELETDIYYSPKNILTINSTVIRRKYLELWYYIIRNAGLYGRSQESSVLLFLEFISCFEEKPVQYYGNLTKKFIRDSLRSITKSCNSLKFEYGDILDIDKVYEK